MKAIFNRTPLIPNACTPLSPGAIRPEGWLGAQLKALEDAVCEDTQALFSGEGGWEREMYAFEALVLLAYTQENDALREEVACRAGQILASQDAEGWFGPADEQGYWPRILALRALRRYFEATADRDVLRFMDAFFKYQHRTLATHPLSDAAVARGGDNILLALWLYNITGQNYLLELCRRLREQTLDWPNYFHTFPNPQPLSRTLRWPRLKEALYEEKDRAHGGRASALFPYAVLPDQRREHRHWPAHARRHQPFQERLQGAGRLPLWLGKADEIPRRRQRRVYRRCAYQRLQPHAGHDADHRLRDDQHAGSARGHGGDVPRHPRHLSKRSPSTPCPPPGRRTCAACRPSNRSIRCWSAKGERAFYNADAEALLFRAPTSFEAVRALSAWPLFVSHLWYATSDARPVGDELRPLLRARAADGRAGAPACLRRLSLRRRGAHRGRRQAPGGVPALSAHAHVVAPADDLSCPTARSCRCAPGKRPACAAAGSPAMWCAWNSAPRRM